MSETISSRFVRRESVKAILEQSTARVATDPALTGLGAGLEVGAVRDIAIELIAGSLGDVTRTGNGSTDQAFAGRGMSSAATQRLTCHLADRVLGLRSPQSSAVIQSVPVPALAA